MNRIIWLASYPKSGNTWLRAFLVNYMDNNTQPANINSLRLPIASRASTFSQYVGVDAHDLYHDEVDQFRPDFYMRYADSDDNVELNGLKFLKIHDAYTYLPDGRPLFPVEATRGIIYIVRNPLDVAVSFSHFTSTSIDMAIDLTANDQLSVSAELGVGHFQLRQRWSSWRKHVESWNSVPNVPRLLIRYEDMIADTFNVFQAVIRFLNFENDVERIQRSIQFSSFDVLKAQEKQEGFVEGLSSTKEFFRKGKVGDWRNELSHEQVIRLVTIHRDTMVRYGYLTTAGEIVY